MKITLKDIEYKFSFSTDRRKMRTLRCDYGDRWCAVVLQNKGDKDVTADTPETALARLVERFRSAEDDPAVCGDNTVLAWLKKQMKA